MNNISINKHQASLSIDELLLQAYPQQQQNWLLTYLDVFVLIIMLVVTLIALSDFEADQQTKRAKTLQKYIQETSSHKNTQLNPIASSSIQTPTIENKKHLQSSPPAVSETKQAIIPKNLAKKTEEFTDLIVEKPIEYIPQALTEQQQKKSIINNNPSTEKIPPNAKEKLLESKIKAEIENLDDYQNDNLNHSNKLSDNTLQKQLQSTVQELGLSGAVNMKVTRGYAQLEIQDKILFKSSESSLLGAGEGLLTKLIPLLTKSSGLIYIEGHTDNRPIKTEKFPSNWELGASRATSVLHFLASQDLDKSRLRAITYADTKPIADNKTKQGRERNRRVSIVIKVSDSVN